MGVYLFNLDTLDRALWEDHKNTGSSHDFGKDILPRLLATGFKVFAYPYTGYWVDVGTVDTYWQAHMDLLSEKPSMDLTDRSWIIHTRTEERPPVRVCRGATIIDSMITDGCLINSDAYVERSVLSPGVQVLPGAKIRDSIILTDTVIEIDAIVERTIIDKRVRISEGARVGSIQMGVKPVITMVGKNSRIAPNLRIEPGAIIGTDVIHTDFTSNIVRGDEYIQTKRMPNEI
jgi:glucose-1-phosphate adenylyltransferase